MASAENKRSRSWFIVCPNIRKNGVINISPSDMAGMSNEEICEKMIKAWCSTDLRSGACLYCVSAKGMEHLHIVLCNKNAISFDSVKKFIGDKAHIEATLGKKADVEAYINKTGRYAESGEKILAKCEEGELIGRQGKRSDLDTIKELIDEGRAWKEIRRLKPLYYDSRYTSIIKNMYFDKRVQETPFKREVRVHWLLGESGSGKTGITLELVERYGEDNIYLVSDYQNPFDGYSGEPVIILDEFRGQLPYATLLGMLEGYKKEMHARYANVVGLWNDVYITTVKSPEQVYSKMIENEDEESDPIGQLLSRLTDVSYCYRVNRANGKKKDRNGNNAEFFRYTVKNYKDLNCGKKYKSRADELKFLAKQDYLDNYHMDSDVVEAFGIISMI